MKKYLSPKYVKEITETKDIITISVINGMPDITVDEVNGTKEADYKISVNKFL